MNKFIDYIREDLLSYNQNDKFNFKTFIYRYFKTPGFKVTTWMRICYFLYTYPCLRPLYLLSRLEYRRVQVKYGIQIGFKLRVSGGFCINHYGGIVIGENAKIGENFNIRHNLTVGDVNGKVPTIGNNVCCGADVIIIGGIHIGDNVLIGAGSVVVKDIPNNSVIVGNPAHIIRKISSEEVKI